MRKEYEIKKITILGAGAFGFAFAKLLESKSDKYQIYLYDVNKSYIDHLKKHREHPVFHEGVKLSEKIHITYDYNKAIFQSQLYILAIPSSFLRSAMSQLNREIQHEQDHKIFLNLAKALEKKTNKRMSEVVEEEITYSKKSIATLSGGMIAKEVALEYPLAADVASRDESTLSTLKSLLETETFRVNLTTDIIGVELAGSFKNVAAIGAGIYKGLGFKESSISAFISDISKEIEALCLNMGAKKQTFESGSQSWWGDLLTTCFGDSRNKYFGQLIGEGYKTNEALELLKEQNKLSEGYNTLSTIHLLLKNYNIETPLIDKLYNIVFNSKPPEILYKNKY